MTVVRCLVPGSYLVRDDGAIPFGQTEASYSVVVHRYDYGWVCERCGFRQGATLQECRHVEAARQKGAR